jgi:hypothetical protein
MSTRLTGIRLQRDAVQDFSDLTSAVLQGEPYWEPGDVLVLPFDREPTAAELARIRRRLVTGDAAEETRVTTYADARTALRKLTNLAGPLAIIVPAIIELLNEQLARYGE